MTDIFILVYLSFDSKSQKVHLCARLTAASCIMEPFGEISANFSLQLSSRTQFAKISYKKVIAENQCEKHKKLEFNEISFPYLLFLKKGVKFENVVCCKL